MPKPKTAELDAWLEAQIPPWFNACVPTGMLEEALGAEIGETCNRPYAKKLHIRPAAKAKTARRWLWSPAECFGIALVAAGVTRWRWTPQKRFNVFHRIATREFFRGVLPAGLVTPESGKYVWLFISRGGGNGFVWISDPDHPTVPAIPSAWTGGDFLDLSLYFRAFGQQLLSLGVPATQVQGGWRLPDVAHQSLRNFNITLGGALPGISVEAH